MGKQRHLSKNSDNESYKLFEVNDVAKYGIFENDCPIEPIRLKLLLYILWKCNATTPGQFKNISVSAEELTRALGYEKDENRNFARSTKKIYKELQGLMSTFLQMYNTDKNRTDSYNVIAHVGMDGNTGMIDIDFGPGLEKLFGSKLEKEFTVVKLMYLNRLNNRASIYLYPFLCRYKNLNFFSYDIRALKLLLTGDENFQYKNLKRRHLIPALEESNQATNLTVEMKENKKGKMVTSLSFHVEEEPAVDELELFVENNQLRFSECKLVPYNDEWKIGYDYDMGKQEYVQKVEGKEYCGNF